MTPQNQLVLRDDVDGVSTLTINRPDQHNALDRHVQEQLHRHLDDIGDDDSIDIVVFTGAGDQAFIAGADINELAVRTPVDGLSAMLQRLFERIANYSKTTIAAVNGYAFGGGHELALACDIRIGSSQAQFSLPETGLGILPAAGGTQRLSALVGQGLALDMILTGRRLSADEALSATLITYLVASDELLDTAHKIAQRIRRKGPLAVKLSREVVKRGAKTDTETGLFLERLAQAVLYSHEEKAEGTRAFQEKRHPDFQSVRHDR